MDKLIENIEEEFYAAAERYQVAIILDRMKKELKELDNEHVYYHRPDLNINQSKRKYIIKTSKKIGAKNRANLMFVEKLKTFEKHISKDMKGYEKNALLILVNAMIRDEDKVKINLCRIARQANIRISILKEMLKKFEENHFIKLMKVSDKERIYHVDKTKIINWRCS